mmetsp:Transcript_16835/g.39712  ORF Transcript_16835/g.39712 Transcript_16835/m.39712 type:complete len:234 (+) Transcript_16835:1459-2160(+)
MQVVRELAPPVVLTHLPVHVQHKNFPISANSKTIRHPWEADTVALGTLKDNVRDDFVPRGVAVHSVLEFRADHLPPQDIGLATADPARLQLVGCIPARVALGVVVRQPVDEEGGVVPAPSELDSATRLTDRDCDHAERLKFLPAIQRLLFDTFDLTLAQLMIDGVHGVCKVTTLLIHVGSIVTQLFDLLGQHPMDKHVSSFAFLLSMLFVCFSKLEQILNFGVEGGDLVLDTR